MLSLKTDVTLQKPVMKHKAGRAHIVVHICLKLCRKLSEKRLAASHQMHHVSSHRLFEKMPSWLLSQFHSAENVIFGRFDVIAPFLINLRRSILRYLGNE